MELLVRVLGSLAAIYGAAYYITAMVDPARFVDWFSINEAERRGEKGLKFYFRFGATLIGCGFFMYARAYSIFQVIPHDWGGVGEDGDWESMRHGLQITFAGFATLGVLSELEKGARRAALSVLSDKELKAFQDVLRVHGEEHLERKVTARKIEEFKKLEEDSASELVRRMSRHELAMLERHDL